jgi:hypothetical protein
MNCLWCTKETKNLKSTYCSIACYREAHPSKKNTSCNVCGIKVTPGSRMCRTCNNQATAKERGPYDIHRYRMIISDWVADEHGRTRTATCVEDH